MRSGLIAFFCLITTFTVAQKLPDGGIYRVRISGDDKTILADIQPADSWIPVDPHKTYYWYSGNTIHSTQGGYSGKPLNGSYTEYYLNKNLKEQGVFKNGLKTRTWKTWNDAGILLSMINWDDGIKSGQFELFDDKGIVKRSGKYRNDEFEGDIKNYVSADSVTVVKYKKGKIVPRGAKKPFWDKINVFKSAKAKPKPAH